MTPPGERLNWQGEADHHEFLCVVKPSDRDNPKKWKYVKNLGKNKIVVDKSMNHIRMTTRYPLSWRADMYKISQETFKTAYREVLGVIHKEFSMIHEIVNKTP